MHSRAYKCTSTFHVQKSSPCSLGCIYPRTTSSCFCLLLCRLTGSSLPLLQALTAYEILPPAYDLLAHVILFYTPPYTMPLTGISTSFGMVNHISVFRMTKSSLHSCADQTQFVNLLLCKYPLTLNNHLLFPSVRFVYCTQNFTLGNWSPFKKFVWFSQ